jgi:hypothetical protein
MQTRSKALQALPMKLNPASHVIFNEAPKHDNSAAVAAAATVMKQATMDTKPQMKQKNEWGSGLLPTYHNCHNCAYATGCPCIWTYNTANLVLKDHAASSAMDDSGCSTCYAWALSAMICAPGLFCMDRSVTKVLNNYADHHESTANEESSFAAGLYNFVTGAGFGTSNATWLNDGDGYDLLHSNETTASEDYWAADWCCYYIYNAFCCNFMRCRTCNKSSVYTPMCFVLMCGAVYPAFICPSTLLLRRIVVSSHNIHESCLESSIFSAFCAPCTMVQTFDELQHSTTTTTNSMK